MSIYASLLTAGTNSHAESSENANAVATDLLSPGVHGVITNTSGVAPTTGDFGVNAQASPNMTVAVNSGVAYVTATPSSQNSQNLRVRNTASANVTISANSSGSTKYDWLYVQVDATKAANPASDASDVATLVTSRSSSSTTDNGTPPTYGTLLAIVTVANGASSITNSNITDKRVRSVAVGGVNDTNGNEVVRISATASAVNDITITNAATGNNPQIAASGDDTNVNLSLTGKGTGGVIIKNPYKFSAYLNSAQTPTATTWTLVNLNTTVYDTGSNFNTTSHIFTAPVSGFYTFKALITYNTIADGTLFGLAFAKNKSTGTIVAPDAQMTFTAGGTSTPESAFYTKDFQLSASDTIALYVYGPANALDTGSAPYYTYMEGFFTSS